MTIRMTLRLPETVHRRLQRASRDSGRSLNQLIVDVLRDAALESPNGAERSPQERLNWALRDLGRPLTEEESEAMAGVFGDESNLPDLSLEELRERMPKLPPDQWLSKAIIEDRDDRS
jgi:hypothetical protein